MDNKPTLNYFCRFKDIKLKDGKYHTIRPLGLIPREEFKIRLMDLHDMIKVISEVTSETSQEFEQIFKEQTYVRFLCDRVCELHHFQFENIELNAFFTLILPTDDYPKSFLFELNFPDDDHDLTQEEKLEQLRKQQESEWLEEPEVHHLVSFAASVLGLTENYQETLETLEEFPAHELVMTMRERTRQLKRAESDAKNKGTNKPSKAMMNKAKHQAKELLERQSNKKPTIDVDRNVKPQKVDIDLGKLM